jgi:hypothetical protein
LEKLLARLLNDNGHPFVLCRLCDRTMRTAGGALCPMGAAARARGIDAG